MELRLAVLDPERLRRALVCEAAASTQALRLVAEADGAVALASDAPADVYLVHTAVVHAEVRALETLALHSPGCCFVLFAAEPDLQALLAAGRLPVRGVLAFDYLAAGEFAGALAVIAHGGAVIEPRSARLLLEYVARLGVPATNGRHQFDLSEREAEVLELVRGGLSNKEIALRLRVSLGTVRAHLRSIFRKLDVRSRAGAAALASGLMEAG